MNRNLLKATLERLEVDLHHLVVDMIEAGTEAPVEPFVARTQRLFDEAQDALATPEAEIAADRCVTCGMPGRLIQHWKTGCWEPEIGWMPGWIRARQKQRDEQTEF